MDMMLFTTAFAAYTVSLLLYAGYALLRREWLALGAGGALAIAVATHVLSLATRTVIGRQMPDHSWYVPWSNWFESFSLFALIISLLFLFLQRRENLPILGVFVMPVIWTVLFVALRSPTGTAIPVLPTALQSHWLALHVPMLFMAYAGFALAFSLGLAYLLQERQLKSKRPSHMIFRMPSLDRLDHLIYKAVYIAFPFLTIGILMGARWAYLEWGRYWGWDAKETWALITWLIYLGYLLCRLVAGWRGRRSAYLSLAGFIAMIMTYIGMNAASELHGFLLP